MRRVNVIVETDWTVLSRFTDKIQLDESGCWIWQGRPGRGGYGLLWVNGYQEYVHRVSHWLFVGPIPDGLHIDHLCRVRICVNPDHLEAVTVRENVVRGIGPEGVRQRQLAKSECPLGHPYSGVNLYVSPDGKRDCAMCRSRREAEHKSRHRHPSRKLLVTRGSHWGKDRRRRG